MENFSLTKHNFDGKFPHVMMACVATPGIRSSIAFYSGCTSARDDGRRGFTKGSDGALRHTGSVRD